MICTGTSGEHPIRRRRPKRLIARKLPWGSLSRTLPSPRATSRRVQRSSRLSAPSATTPTRYMAYGGMRGPTAEDCCYARRARTSKAAGGSRQRGRALMGVVRAVCAGRQERPGPQPLGNHRPRVRLGGGLRVLSGQQELGHQVER